MDHISFWQEFVGKVGAPIFAGTLVACLLSVKFAWLHLILMATGIGMMALSHWGEYHRKASKGEARPD